MQLKKLYIKYYKILKDFTLEFPFDSKKYISVFIGANGSGKSTIFEAIAKIFSWVLLDEKAEFEFELEYSIIQVPKDVYASAGKKMVPPPLTVNIFTQKIGDKPKIRLRMSETEYAEKPDLIELERLLPEKVIIYYAGLSDILKGVVEQHTEKYSRSIRELEGVLPQRRFFYFEPFHFNLLLLSLFSFEFGYVPEKLRIKYNIFGFKDFRIHIKKPYWYRKKLDINNSEFWGAEGKIDVFLKQLVGLNPKISNISDEGFEMFFNQRFQLMSIMDLHGSEKEFFNLLEMTWQNDLIESIDITVAKNIDNKFEYFNSKYLSEGEQQSLAILGLNELVGEKNSLLMFDEPDTYLHPLWQNTFISEIENNIKENPNIENSFLIATHSPQILSNAHPEFTSVRILEEGKLIERTPKHFGKDIASILFQHMGVEERNKTIQKQISSLYTLIEEEELEAAQKELMRLKELLGDDDTEVLKAQIQIDYLKEDEED